MDRQARDDFDRMNPIESKPAPAPASAEPDTDNTKYEYVVETPQGLEYCFPCDTVEDVAVDHGVAALDFNDGTSQAFGAGYWTRFYMREVSPEAALVVEEVAS